MDFTTLISLLVGGAITWAVSWVYYRRASADLVREAGRLREQNNLMLRALREFAESGNVEYNADPETGEPHGLHIRRSSSESVGISDSAQVKLTKGEEPPYDQQKE